MKKVIVLAVSLFLLVGCGPTSTPLPAPTDTPVAATAARITLATNTPLPPTATPPPPTATPAPTTNTPLPPTPTETATPQPTRTPLPTDTPTRLPSLTGSGGGVIAFVSRRDGNFAIYVMNADGSDQRRLTYNDAGDWAPAWSPDGTQLAFSSERDGNMEIHVMDLSDGIGARATEQDPPDQQRLTYREADDWDPDWSPDGTRIVFHSEGGDGGFDIWLMNTDGSDTRRLTNTAYDEIHLAWSPDGNRFAFESTRDGNYQIYVMAADTRAPGSLDQQRLTSHVAGNRFPDWSPDGSQIAFTSKRDGNYEIYVMNADGSNPQRLTFNDAEDWDPAWSPDGTQIAFRSKRDGNWEIYAMNADGSNQRRLTNTSADDHYPAWWPATEPSDDSQAHAAGDTLTRPADGMTMVYVPGGTFPMGSTAAEVDAAISQCKQTRTVCQRAFYEYELPQHDVSLESFWLDRTELTNAQYRRCVEAGACQAPVGCNLGRLTYGDQTKVDHPVTCVTWREAQMYCEWAGGRLPTEAEWEYAARGPEGLLYPWGNTFDGTRLNSCDVNCTNPWADGTLDDGYAESAPVGSYPNGASWCGALDMAGNVWEWVADWMGTYPAAVQTMPTGPTTGTEKVLRGSSWVYDQERFRTPARDSIKPGQRDSPIGFRCALPAEQ
jgi:TolB protein